MLSFWRSTCSLKLDMPEQNYTRVFYSRTKRASILLIGVLTIAIGAAQARDSKAYFRQRTAQKSRGASGTVVVNAASFESGMSPGGLATVFGIDLTSVNGVLLAGTNPLPTLLGGVQVIVNGLAAPIFSVAYANGEDQISFQVPYETPVGPGAGFVRVLDHGSETANLSVDSFTEDPGIFVYQGQYAVALSGTDYSLIGPGNATFPGEVLLLYTTGLGPLSLNLTDGYGAPSDQLAYTLDPLQVVVDGENCKVLFSGLAPGFVGLYQVNFVVPNDARSGNLSLQIQTPFASSTNATLPVEADGNRPDRNARTPLQK